MDPYTVPFFHDYLLILRRIDARPIRLTKTEKRLSLPDMAELIPKFVQQKSIEEHKKFGWKICLERDIAFLEQARVMMEVNGLVHKRKDRLCLTKDGKRFLVELSPLDQYVRMVHTYWEEVNWGYFSYGSEVAGKSMTKLFQSDQTEIWRALKDYGYEWCDYRQFCRSLDKHFELGRYKDQWDGAEWSWGKIERFRTTYLGLYALERYVNYLGPRSA